MIWIWRDGRVLAQAPLVDPAWAAWGAFTTAGACGGRPLLWPWHRERLAATLLLLEPGLEANLPAEAAVADLLDRSELSGPGRVRVVARRSERETGWTVEASATPWQGGGAEAAPLRLVVERWPAAGPLAEHKTLARLPWELARRRAQRLGADDAVLVDGAGRVLETTVSNLFARFGVRLVTPLVPGRCLPGVMRRWLVESAVGVGLEVVERDLGLDELLAADEVWATNALVGVRRVATVGTRRWRQWEKWPAVAGLGVPAPGWSSAAGAAE